MSAPAIFDVEFLTNLRNRPTARPTPSTEPIAQTSEYSILGLSRAADQAAVRDRQVGFTLVLFAVATIIAVLYSIERYPSAARHWAIVPLRQDRTGGAGLHVRGPC